MSNNSICFNLDKLRERCEEINPLDGQETIKILKNKLKKYPDLYALSAPQVNKQERVICIKYSDGMIKEYINPIVVESKGYHLVREKDISIPDKEYIAIRPSEINVKYQLSNAKPEENILKGVVAEVFDRMMNYLDGVCLDEYGLEVIPEFDEASEEEKQQVIDAYLNSFKKREELLNDNIEHDDEAKQLRAAIKFMDAVKEGKITLEHFDDLKVEKTEDEKDRVQ